MSIFNKFSLNDQVSVVTGAARGLGKAMAEALVQAGSNLVIADIDFDEATKTANDIMKDLGKEVMVVRTDVTKEESVNSMVAQVIEQFGRIDVLINNAGIVVNENAENMSIEDWYKVIDINLNGVFIVSKAVGKVMIKQNKGSIINISSMSGIIANTPQCQSSYNASKAGVIMLTKSLAMEWAKFNIRVNTIAPGYMKTELTKKFFDNSGDMVDIWMNSTPLGRPGLPEELGGIALYLASNASSYATGSVFTIDGGYTAL